LGGYQIDTCLPFSLYLPHGFYGESDQPYRNKVKDANPIRKDNFNWPLILAWFNRIGSILPFPKTLLLSSANRSKKLTLKTTDINVN